MKPVKSIGVTIQEDNYLECSIAFEDGTDSLWFVRDSRKLSNKQLRKLRATFSKFNWTHEELMKRGSYGWEYPNDFESDPDGTDGDVLQWFLRDREWDEAHKRAEEDIDHLFREEMTDDEWAELNKVHDERVEYHLAILQGR